MYRKEDPSPQTGTIRWGVRHAHGEETIITTYIEFSLGPAVSACCKHLSCVLWASKLGIYLLRSFVLGNASSVSHQHLTQ